MTFGRLELTVQLDLGGLGPSRSEPVTVFWVPLYNYPLPVLWAAFALILLAGGVHRQPRLLLAAIPVALVHWVLRILSRSGNFTFVDAALMGQVFAPLAIALAGILVLVPHWSRRDRRLGLPAAVALMILIGILSALAYNLGADQIDRTGRTLLILYLIMGVALLTAAMLAFVLSDHRCTRPRFAVWLQFGAFVLTVLGVLVFGCCDFHPRDFDDFMEVLAIGLVCGLSACGIALPFLILLHLSPFFEQRLQMCMLEHRR